VAVGAHPAALGCHLDRRLIRRRWRYSSRSRSTTPVRGLGWKNVVLGGMRSPPWAMATIWATEAGRRTNPACISPDPTRAIPEKSWAYRLAKRLFFNDFGTYEGRDHSAASAPAMIARGEGPVQKEPDVVELEV